MAAKIAKKKATPTPSPISLKKKPDAYLRSAITLPAGATKITLKPPKTVRLIAGEQTLQPDGILAYRQNGKLTIIAIQAEDSTGTNVSALLGKALLSQLCNDNYSLIRIDEVISGTVTRATRVDRIVVVFLFNESDKKVKECVTGVVKCLSPVNELAYNVFTLPVDLSNDPAAITELSNIVSRLPQI